MIRRMILVTALSALMLPTGNPAAAAAAQEPEGPYEFVGAVEGTWVLDTQSPFSPDGTRLVTQADVSLRVWDVRTLQPLCTVPTGPDVVDSCGFIEGGKRLFVAVESALCLFDASTGALRRKTRVTDDQTIRSEASEDGKHLVTFDRTGVQIWRPGVDRPERVLRPSALPQGTTFDTAGNLLILQLLDGGRPYRLFSLKSGGEPFPLPSDAVFLYAHPFASFDHGGSRVLVPCEAGFKILDVRTGRVTVTGRLDKDFELYAASFSPDGSRVIVETRPAGGLNYGPVHVFDAATGKLLHRLGSDACAAELTPDNRWAIVSVLRQGEGDGHTEVWDVAAERRLQVLQHGSHNEYWISRLSPNGDVIAQFVQGDHTLLWRRRGAPDPRPATRPGE